MTNFSSLTRVLKARDLGKLCELSARLGNCIYGNPGFFDFPLSEILRSPEPMKLKLKRAVPNFGEKSANELLQKARMINELAVEVNNQPFTLAERLGATNPEVLEMLRERVCSPEGKAFLDTSVTSSLLIPSEDKGGLEEVSRNGIAQCFDLLHFRPTLSAYNLTTRAGNVLLRNSEIIDKEFRNFGDVIRKNNEWSRFIRNLPNVGRKTVEEINEVVRKVLWAAIRQGQDRQASEEWFSETEQFVRELLVGSKQLFSSHPINEGLDGLAAAVVKLKYEDVVAENEDYELIPNELIAKDPVEAIEAHFDGYLTERDSDVLKRRIGLRHGKKQTLEEIAGVYEVTRERIRQLESKAKRKLSAKVHINFFSRVLENTQDDWFITVLSNRKAVRVDDVRELENELPAYARISIEFVYGGTEEFLNSQFEEVYHDGKKSGWLASSLNQVEKDDVLEALGSIETRGRSIRSAVKHALENSTLPFRISKLVRDLLIFSKEEIIATLQQDLGASLQGDEIIGIKKLSVKARIILSLRSIGRPAHVSEIAELNKELFDVEINEHAVSAALARLEEVLIVDRGHYCLYEHLNLSEREIRQVADFCFEQLKSRQAYTSTKILTKELATEVESLAARLTPYLVLGICQDDPRFSVKRGLMIGLALKGFDTEFSSLTESLYSLVVENGPITLSEMVESISDTRDVLQSSANNILDNLDDVIRSSPSTYDYLPRVFGNASQLSKITQALSLCVIDSPCSLHVISSRIEALGWRINKVALLSLIRKLDEFSIDHSLIEFRAMNTRLRKYNQVFHDNFDADFSEEFNRQKIEGVLQDDPCFDLIELDFRLHLPVRNWHEVSSKGSEEDSVIDEILRDFDF